MAHLYFALICLLFGSNFFLMSRATLAFGPMEIGFWRVASAGLVLALIWGLAARKARLRKEELPKVLFVALIANCYPYVAQPLLISQGFGHSFFGMMVAFAPLLTILVSVPMLGIWPSWRQVVGVLVGLVCIGLLMADGSSRGIEPWMLLVAVSVPLSYAVGNTYLRRYLQHAAPTPMSTVMMAISSAALAPLAFGGFVPEGALGEPARTPTPDQWPVAVAALATLGFLGTGGTIWMFVRLVQDRGPLFAGMVTYVVPVLALLWGLVDGEKITTIQLVAIGGVLSMVALVQSAPPESGDAIVPADSHETAADEEDEVAIALID
ncbi:EamA-like transporter family protein [Pseudobythopirellula maris]|uniref:EamA-like transporter family protein n=1 Tax=Pseudobythopirellula maris TaxID=2527991 RepID=A0A5C5ZLL6_9BACT|nr:DMT family transporter [Pseudobythopirellula maris]TWT87721.1 EamA-like transporter family protein [Pseudobythopirellula maris]